MSSNTEEINKCKIFVGGISVKMTEEQLSEYFKQFGKIQSCEIVKSKKHKQPLGFAFIEYADEEGAQTALSTKHIIEGRHIDTKPHMKGKGIEKQGNDVKERKIYVGNLSLETTKHHLNQFFSEFGKIDKAYIIFHHKTGDSRGFGFVEFVNKISVQKVLKHEEVLELKGNQLEIKSLVLKKEAIQRRNEQKLQVSSPTENEEKKRKRKKKKKKKAKKRQAKNKEQLKQNSKKEGELIVKNQKHSKISQESSQDLNTRKSSSSVSLNENEENYSFNLFTSLRRKRSDGNQLSGFTTFKQSRMPYLNQFDEEFDTFPQKNQNNRVSNSSKGNFYNRNWNYNQESNHNYSSHQNTYGFNQNQLSRKQQYNVESQTSDHRHCYEQ